MFCELCDWKCPALVSAQGGPTGFFTTRPPPVCAYAPPHTHLPGRETRACQPKSKSHWYGKWKTREMCMGLFGERQRARHEWIANGPRRGREEAHATAVVTYHASPVRSRTVKVCLVCLWISPDLDAEHG
jgi:hypothetical protein